eukprot:TRINITY_DN5411_c0_g1_i5.p1 TRINITY_DN5411_c0_g1~~TRINITY_DN5411_c0_g1_i5.p1  ORF type:complete len:976 (-),score=225.41 TRINITY_DN5411_c0_g1_i5:26-2803(-)
MPSNEETFELWTEEDDGLKCKHLRQINPQLVKKVAQEGSLACVECNGGKKKRDKTKARKGKGKEKASDNATNNKSSHGLWICLTCGHVGCGREQEKHAEVHSKTGGNHPLVFSPSTMQVWCYSCDDEVSVNPDALGADGADDDGNNNQANNNSNNGNNNRARSEAHGKLLKCINMFSAGSKDDGSDGEVVVDNHKASSGNPNRPADEQKGKGKGKGKRTTKDQEQEQEQEHAPITVSPGSLGTGVKGLRNLGNTCFFNSIMQNITRTQLLRDIYLGLAVQPGYDDTVVLNKGLTAAFRDFMSNMWTGSATIFSPSNIFAQICRKAPRFKGFRQQDSHELLRFLLDGLGEEEAEYMKAHGKAPNKHATIVKRVFGGVLCSTITCHQCQSQSKVTEPFLDISIPIPEPPPEPKKGKQTAKPSASSSKSSSSSSSSSSHSIPSSSQPPKSSSSSNNITKSRRSRRREQLIALRHGKTASSSTPAAPTSSSAPSPSSEDTPSSPPPSTPAESSSIPHEDSIIDPSVERPPSPVTPETQPSSSPTLPSSDSPSPPSTETTPSSDIEPSASSSDPLPAGDSAESQLVELASNVSINENGDEDNGADNQPSTEPQEESPSPLSNSSHPSEEPQDNKEGEGKEGEQEPREEVKETIPTLPVSYDLRSPIALGPVGSAPDVQHCLAAFTDPEVLDESNQYGCRECTRRTRRALVGKIHVSKNGKIYDTPDFETWVREREICGETSDHDDDVAFDPRYNATLSHKELLFWEQTIEKQVTGGKKLKGTEATKQFLFSAPLPRVLTLHLKRFSQTARGGLQKLSKDVSFPLVLDLAPFCMPGTPHSEYQLTGIVEHSGTMAGGHYVAYTYCAEADSWYYFSDTSFHKVSVKEVMAAEAYLLFYRRVNEDTEGMPHTEEEEEIHDNEEEEGDHEVTEA